MITTLYAKVHNNRTRPQYFYFDEHIDPNDIDRLASVAAWMGLGPTSLSTVEKNALAMAYAGRLRTKVRTALPGWTKRFLQDGSTRPTSTVSLTKKIEAYLSLLRKGPLPDEMMFDETNLPGLASLASSLGIGPTCLPSEEKAMLATSYQQRYFTGASSRLPGWAKRYPTAETKQPARRFRARGIGAAVVSQVIHVNPLTARGMFQAAHEHVSPMVRDTLDIGYLDCRNPPLSLEHSERLAFPHTVIYDHPPEADEIDVSIADLLMRSCGLDPEPKWIGVRDRVLFSVHENGLGDRYYTLTLYMTSAYSTTRGEWIDPQIERNHL